MLDGKISLQSFLENVYKICKIIPVLDMLHGVKTGRSKIMNKTIKLGENCDLFNSISLSVDLQMFDEFLSGQTALGKMRDIYPIYFKHFLKKEKKLC